MFRRKYILLEPHRTYSQTHVSSNHPQLCHNEVFYDVLRIWIVLFIEFQFFEEFTVNFLVVMLDLTLDKLNAILVHFAPLEPFLSVHVVEEGGGKRFEQ